MDLIDLKEKLRMLEGQLADLEGRQMSEITRRRIDSDMGDDYRENEGAKLVMEQHDIWYIRKIQLKKAILELKKLLLAKK